MATKIWKYLSVVLFLMTFALKSAYAADAEDTEAADADPKPQAADDADDEEDTSKMDMSKFKEPKLQWFEPPARTCPMEHDFCKIPEPKLPGKAERRQLAGIAGGVAAAGSVIAGAAPVILETLGHANAALGNVAGAGGSVNGIISGAISNLNGIGSLIRGGIDLAKVFGLGPTTRAIIVDNRCKETCDLWVRCTSQGKDSGYIPLEYPDGYILKFVTHLPGWEYGIGNFGFTFWNCEYKNALTGRVITQPAFGGQAPRETVNLFEVRKKGLFRMDKETGRIDARQSVIFW